MVLESSNKIVVEERLGLQRANFPRDLGVKTPLMICEDRVSSSDYRDEVSLSRPPSSHEFPGRIRMCHDDYMLPFVWIEREKVRWCYVERYCELSLIHICYCVT